MSGHAGLRRIATAVRSGAREYRRTPVLLALLVGLPAYAILVFEAVMPDTPVAFRVAGEPVRQALPGVAAAFMTPMVAALLTAIAGLFLMQSARNDGRLLVAGYGTLELVLARLGLLAGIGAVASAVSVAVMATAFTPERLLPFAVAVWLAALLYGMTGVLVGATLDRLPGIYLLLFGTMLDLFLFQNPLASDAPALAVFLPGHYPMAAAMAAGFTGSVDPATFGLAVAALGVLTAAGTVAFARRMRLG